MDTDSVSQVLNQPEFMTNKHEDFEAEPAKQLLGQIPSADFSVTGIKDTLSALANGRVDELLISKSFHISNFELSDIPESLLPDSMMPNDSDNTQLHRLLIADVLVKYALRSGARVTFIENSWLLREFDGIGAFLRRRTNRDKHIARRPKRFRFAFMRLLSFLIAFCRRERKK